jgi:hypothetical protein
VIFVDQGGFCLLKNKHGPVDHMYHEAHLFTAYANLLLSMEAYRAKSE